MNRILSLVAFTALLVLGSAAADAQNLAELRLPNEGITLERRTAPVAIGSWDSTYGILTMIQREDGRFIGNYSSYGRINGRMEGGKLIGQFFHPDNSGTCSTARQGSTNWGRFEFTFAPDGSSFKGKWNWCGEELTETWNATKL